MEILYELMTVGCGVRETEPRTSETAALGVVMPVFNEAKSVGMIIERVLRQIMVRELIVVDDGSDDGTWEQLQPWPAKDARVKILRHLGNYGKGAAIRMGITLSTAPFIIVQDADLEYDPEDFGSLLAPLLRGEADVVYGSRFDKRSRSITPRWHRFGNIALTKISNWVSGLTLTDQATCYKMFRRDVLQGLRLQENGFGFCPEITAKVSKLGARVREVPISYRGRTRSEGKKITLFHGFEALWCMVWYNWFSGQLRNGAKRNNSNLR